MLPRMLATASFFHTRRLRRHTGPKRADRVGTAQIFVVAWIGQFVGHSIEGTRPSFFKDVQFLLIGPVWLMSHVYRRLGLAY